MAKYFWDTQVEYLRHSRALYYNDDYIEFLVKMVWKIETPVHVIDFGCGYGYLGLKLLPLLPKGSKYTGIDLGDKLLQEAKDLFAALPYETEFVQGDIQEMSLERKYDIAICHSFLLHVSDPKAILKKMLYCVEDGGKVITFEPHWISSSSGFYLHGYDQSSIVQLGLLQKLYEKDAARIGKDGNIGMKIPMYLSQLGLKDNYLTYFVIVIMLNHLTRIELHLLTILIERGATQTEAEIQYENELLL
ncbi:SAM-dependent methyltransferase [Bacillus horti]|uniref:SAM-dependent methyltransferase n=1 Tax=Caldalkalibacillus horti TaxID=77523 RepID=A0ABT9W192_9BACI|nr:SAM-dependent methyltransferase [Bacillus horti]